MLLGWLVTQALVACGGSDSEPGTTATGGSFTGQGGATDTTSGNANGGYPQTTSNLSGLGSGGVTLTTTSVVTTGGTSAAGETANTGGTSLTSTVAGTGGVVTTGGTATGGMKATGGTTSTGGTKATGGTMATDCSAPPSPSPLVGWAAVSGNGTTTTTGGGNATPVTVTTLAQLQAAAKGTTASVIYVKGVLPNGVVEVGSNKTIVGICGAEIHGHLELNGSVNVIIRNIKIVGYAVGNCASDPAFNSSVGCSSGADAISVQNGAHHIWFDHCDISDGTDGNLDVTKGSDYITISWTKFHYTSRTDNQGSDSTGASGHRYSNLIGGSDTEASAGKLNITWHHNWWANNVYERQPQVRFGKNHLFNNLWTSSGNNFCVRAVIDAHILIENNVFSGVKDPHLFYGSASSTSYITADSAKNTYTNATGSKLTGGSGAAFAPTYSYSMDALAQVQSLVTNGVGPK